MSAALSMPEWVSAGSAPALRDFEDAPDAPEIDCAECAQLRRELADAKTLLRKISQMTPKPTKPEFQDSPADCVLLGYVATFSIIKARIELFLKGRA